MQAPLPEVEKEWHFRREAGVPAWINLYVGRAARNGRSRSRPRNIRSRRRSGSNASRPRSNGAISADDPDNWSIGYFCAIHVPAEFSAAGMPITWCGNRSSALSDPAIRPGSSTNVRRFSMAKKPSSFANKECRDAYVRLTEVRPAWRMFARCWSRVRISGPAVYPGA